MAAAPPPRPVLKRQGFQLDGRCFSVQGVGRVSGSRLTELFHPQRLRLKRDQKAAEEEARRLFRKPFFAAQLRYYGIKFPGSSTVQNLQLQLRDAVMQGQCDDVPESIINLESKMRQDHESAVRRWEEATRAWQDEQERSKNEAFRNARTPTEQATCDLPRFMAHYFLTDGKPDPSKTPEPLVLHGFVDRSSIHAAAERIFGLQTHSGGSGDSRAVCIGWDRGKVFSAAGNLDNLAYNAQEEARRITWETAMEEHHEFVSQHGRGKKSRKSKTKSETFDLATCAGSYIVQCKEIASEWPDQATVPFTIDISTSQGGRGVVAAAFDFGILEGTMVLSLDEEALEVYDDDDEDSEENMYEDEYSDGEDSGDDEDDDRQVPRKRKASSSLPTGRQAKKKKGTTTKSNQSPHRVYFKVRGRETGEGEIFYGAESGYIEFLDDEGFVFDGVAGSLSFVGRNVEFSGYKVSAQPEREPESWSSFSYGAYERERVGRWR